MLRLLLISLSLILSLVSSSPAGDFAVSRIKYNGGGDWYSDPTSLPNLQKFLERECNIPTAEKENIISLLDDDLFSHPYLYLTGHGNVKFSDEEVTRLREYLLGGGFLHCDDNYGIDESFRREMKKVFPEREFEIIPFSNPIYHIGYSFPRGLPKIHEHDNKPPQGFGIVIEGRIVVFYTYECDLGDGWEDEEVHNDPLDKREAALKMGANIILYALSGKPRELP